MGSTNYCKYTFDNEFQCMVYITEPVLDVLCLNRFWLSRVLTRNKPILNVGMCFKIGIRKPYTEYAKYEMLNNIRTELEKCERLPIKKDMNIYLQIADELPFIVIHSGDETDSKIAADFRALSLEDIPRREKAQSFNPCYFIQAFEVDPLKKIMEKELAEIRKPLAEYAPDKDKRIKELEAQLPEKDAKIAELEDELRRLRGDYDAREQERDAAQAAFEEADKENVKLSAEIDALKEQINKLEEDKFDIGTSLEIAEGTAEQLEVYIDELEKKLNPPKPKPNEPRYITIKGVKYRV